MIQRYYIFQDTFFPQNNVQNLPVYVTHAVLNYFVHVLSIRAGMVKGVGAARVSGVPKNSLRILEFFLSIHLISQMEHNINYERL
jgi:hypothetical protein